MPNLPVISGTVALAKYAASGVGGIASTILASWRASKEGKARLTSAQYDAKVRVIEAETEAQTLQIMAGAQAKIRQTADQQMDIGNSRLEINRAGIDQMIEFQSYKRMANTSAVIEDAAEDLADKEVSDHEPDPDWTTRFFDCVKDVSSEDMQKLWARILSGEVESPGRTSLRTLDILRNMTVSDARMFQTLCTFMMRNDFVFYDDSVKDINGLIYNVLLHLQDCGLVSIGPQLQITLNFTDEGSIVLFGQNSTLLINSEQDSPPPLNVPAVPITIAGRELASIARCTPNQDYLRAFAKFLKTKNCQLYRLEGAARLPENRIGFSAQILIEP
ncbi:MAG: DUF2806 domain-containing protein [Gemmatimonadota bacterium]|nr:DUF2806 domain-containing protein [Gemmatimonadota bacterium]